MRRITCVLFVLCLGASVCLAADADGIPAITSAEKAGLDFKIQGEYSGVLEADGNKWGAQVIALGDGKFQAVGLLGGLPGDGWSRNDEVNRLDGEMKDGKAVFTADEYSLVIDGKVLQVVGSDGENLGELKKVKRKSPTLGAKPPKGATVLFDGSSIDNFNDAKMMEGNLLGATNVHSKLKLGDHKLHLEFRTPFMPKSRGQGRGNSGMYVQSRYEVQILDSFGLDGKDNECGGIYSINQPIVNMCFPPLSWQTYDYEFTAAKYDDNGSKIKNARITIKHNGVVIHDNLELKHGTPGRFQEGPEKQPLFLQDHGNPVAFRNIWVVEK